MVSGFWHVIFHDIHKPPLTTTSAPCSVRLAMFGLYPFKPCRIAETLGRCLVHGSDFFGVRWTYLIRRFPEMGVTPKSPKLFDHDLVLNLIVTWLSTVLWNFQMCVQFFFWLVQNKNHISTQVGSGINTPSLGDLPSNPGAQQQPRIGLMTLGVCFAALFTIAKIMGAWTATENMLNTQRNIFWHVSSVWTFF